MRPLVAVIAVSLFGAPPARAEEVEAQTVACIADNEGAQVALREGNAERALELARRCAVSECATLLRQDCSALADAAEEQLRPWELRSGPGRPRAMRERKHSVKRTAHRPPAVPPQPASEGPSALPSVVLAGVAVAGFTSFAVFGLRGRARERGLACSPRCSDDDVSAVGRDYLIADLSLGAGVLALAASAYFYPWGRERPVQATVGTRRVTLRMSF